MSQYSSPYLPPSITPSYGAPMDVLKPARRASVMMFVMGGLMILFSSCMIGVTFMFALIPPEQLQPLRDRVQSMANMSPEMLFRIAGALVLVIGMLLVGMAFFVRRGGLVSAILSTVLVGLIVLQQILSLLDALTTAKDAAGLGSLVASFIMFAAFMFMFVWLIQAARAAPKVKAAQQQYLAQYWQYQQQAQAYTGYPTQPPAPPEIS